MVDPLRKDAMGAHVASAVWVDGARTARDGRVDAASAVQSLLYVFECSGLNRLADRGRRGAHRSLTQTGIRMHSDDQHQSRHRDARAAMKPPPCCQKS
jgi:hypothetical protein